MKLYSTSSQQKCFLRIPRPRHSGPSSASAFGSSRREIAIIYRFKVAMMCAGLAAGHCTVGVERHRSRVDIAIWGGGIISESREVKVFMPFIEFEYAYNIIAYIYGLAIEFTLIDFGY